MMNIFRDSKMNYFSHCSPSVLTHILDQELRAVFSINDIARIYRESRIPEYPIICNIIGSHDLPLYYPPVGSPSYRIDEGGDHISTPFQRQAQLPDPRASPVISEGWPHP